MLGQGFALGAAPSVMRIGFLTASLSRRAGGIFESVRRPAQEFQNSGFADVRVFGLRDDFTDADLPAWGSLWVKTFPVRGVQAFGYSPGLIPELFSAELDILQVNGLWMYPSVASLHWARNTRKPHLVRTEGMLDPWALSNSRWKKKLAGWFYEINHLRKAACLIALCEAEAESIRAFGLRNPIAVIPNGIDIPETRILDVGDVTRGPLRLLYLGRLHPKKGLPNLLRAWGFLYRQGAVQSANWELAIAGWDQGGHEKQLKALCREFSLGNSVRFLGPRFGLEKEITYRSADAFVLPSFSEGLPVAVLEAWAFGLPVLITRECHLPEGVAAGAAISIRPEVESIVRGLETLFQLPPAEKKEMGKRGRRLVIERYSWSKIAAELYTLYRWVLGEEQRPECVRSD